MRDLHNLWLGIGVVAALGACGDDGGSSEATAFDVQTEAAGSNCPGGGVKLLSGFDENGDGVLEGDEVADTDYVCDASAPRDGSGGGAEGASLVAVMPLPVGDTACPGGGVRIVSGIDANGDGVLDADEASTSSPICDAGVVSDGPGGSGLLIETSSLDVGDPACALGGIAISQGIDSNADGMLDASETDSVSYACNGSPGIDSPAGCGLPGRWDAVQGQCVRTGDWSDIDLSGVDVSNSYLAGVDFSGSTLNGADLSWTELRGADFQDADLTGANLANANVDRVNFDNAIFDGADLSGVDLRDAASIDGVHGTGLIACPRRLPDGWACADLGNAGLTLIGPGVDLSGLDLGGADLSGVDLRGTQVTALIQCPADLPNDWHCLDLGPAGWTLVGPGADLSGLDVTGGDFGPARNLRDVNFDDATAVDATFGADTDFQGASFDNASFIDAVFGDNADMRSVRFDGTDLGGVDLSQARFDDVRGTHLADCPQALPSQWNCIATPQTGNTLFGPGANLQGLDLSGAQLPGQVLDNANLDDANLSNADLQGASLDGASLDQAVLDGAVLDNADLRNADLQDASLVDASLVGADLSDADLRNADLQNADLQNAVLDTARLDNADLRGAVLDGADLTNASVQDANMSNVSMVGADLNNADFQGANFDGVTAFDLQTCPDRLPGQWDCVQDGTGNGTRVLVGPGANLGNMGVDLSGSNLADVNLSGADVAGVDFSSADLQNADLSGADLSGADLSGADLQNADMTGADLTGANLSGANTTGVMWDNTICPNGGNSDANAGTCV